jgi:signal transduction histidine kinase
LETIKDKPDLPQTVHNDLINRCYTNCTRLIRLLDDVSALTRMDEGSEQISKDLVCLNTIVDEVVDDMLLRQTSTQMQVHINMPDKITLQGNQTMLFSIFRNLIANSRAYSGGQNIYISAVEKDGTVQCKFEDDGVGVDSQHLPHLFERFYRVDKGRSRKLGGTGLGLSIVKHAVLIHGGTITVQPRHPSGLTFAFTLIS